MRQDTEKAVSRQEAVRCDEIKLRRHAAVRRSLAGRQPEQVAADGLVNRRSVVNRWVSVINRIVFSNSQKYLISNEMGIYIS